MASKRGVKRRGASKEENDVHISEKTSMEEKSTTSSAIDGLDALLLALCETGALRPEENAAIALVEEDLGKTPAKSVVRRELENSTRGTLQKWWLGLAKRLSSLESQDEKETRSEAQFLGVIALLATTYFATLAHDSTRGQEIHQSPPKGVFECLKYAHDKSLQLIGDDSTTQKQICRACELWWLAGFPDKEELVPHTLPLLLIFSLDEDAKKSDVKRVYTARKMLFVLDMEDDSSVSLKHLLLRCFISPTYLCTESGSKFLTELCFLHEDFLTDIHATVKTQLPFAAEGNSEQIDESLIEKYAQIYFRAWRDAPLSAPHMQSLIEKGLIQDLMDAAVHVANPSLASAVFHFLNRGFHDNKNAKGVDALLLRLYNPIIWRALSVANPVVRYRATRLLARAFPLQDPEAPIAESDEILQQQFTAIETLLKDHSPMVRVAAIQGACRMLSIYWELIPRKATVSLIAMLVGELLHDSSSPSVRVAVIKGLEFISENPLSQNALKDVLPHVSPLIHDQSKLVRTAVVSLLLRVKTIRAIKFYEVVPIDHLLERLAMDEQLGSKITKLILESFFPQGVPGSEQLRRILSLVQDHPLAAARFLENVHKHLSPGPVCKLAMLLGLWALDAASKGPRALQLSEGNEGDEDNKGGEQMNGDCDSDNFGSKQEHVLGVLQGIAVLWSSVASSLASSRHKAARKKMEQTFGFASFVKPILEGLQLESKLVLSPLLEIAANLPRDETFLEEVLIEIVTFQSELTLDNFIQLEEHQIEKELTRIARELGPALHCLCYWEATDKLLQLLNESLGAATASLDVSSAPSKRAKGKATSLSRKKKKTVKTKGESTIAQPFIAVWCFQFVLANNPGNAREALFSSKELLCEFVETMKSLKVNSFVFEALAKLSVHEAALQVQSSEQLVSEDGGEIDTTVDNGDARRPLPDGLHELLEYCEELQKVNEGETNTTKDGEAKNKKKRKNGEDKENKPFVNRNCSILAVSLSECVAVGAMKQLDENDKEKCVTILENVSANKSLKTRFAKRFGLINCS
mmetsp:Transcript_742/g.1094  ORF Transcript_742/g.1094 Transcript_742/m.1094 type:complete len:1036 (+) Transcript_742:189-3296(+)